MSTKAQAILDQIQALPPEEQAEVLDQALRLREGMLQWGEQKKRLRELQARYAGSGLLKRLLEERAKERARG